MAESDLKPGNLFDSPESPFAIHRLSGGSGDRLAPPQFPGREGSQSRKHFLAISPPVRSGSGGTDDDSPLRIMRHSGSVGSSGSGWGESPARRRRKRKCLIPTGAYNTGTSYAKAPDSGIGTPQRSLEEQSLEHMLAMALLPSRQLNKELQDCDQPFAVTEWMSCGTAKFATDAARVAREGFTHVINLCPHQCLTSHKQYAAHGIELTLIFAHDSDDYPLLSNHFAQCLRVANRARRANGRILLHCLKAVNRSVAMAIAVQLKCCEDSQLPDIVRCVALMKSPVLQNIEFRRQLIHFSRNMQLYASPGGSSSSSSDHSSSPLPSAYSPVRGASPCVTPHATPSRGFHATPPQRQTIVDEP